MNPYAWQVEPSRILASALVRQQSALDASDTGTGKTYQALFAAKTAGKRVAVICPKSVIPAWREACLRVGVDDVFIANIEWLKVNGPWLSRNGKAWEWNVPADAVLIFDEVHRFSASDSQNAKILASAPAPVLMLSATAAGDPTKMRAIAHQLGLTSWGQWWQWCGRNGCKKGYFGGIEFKGTPADLDKLHRQIFATGRGVRVRIPELGDQFPSNTVEAVSVPVADQAAVDAAYVEELQALEAGADPMIATLRARQIAEHQKLPAIVELAENLIAEGNSVAIFVNFRDSLERICDALGGKENWPQQIHGDQTPDEREDAIEAFNENIAEVIVCMIQAGGVGLSLHDLNGRPRVSLICPGWSAIELRQALGRIHRAGSKSPALQKILFAEGTVEERIRRKIETKLSRINALNDGDLAPTISACAASQPIETQVKPIAQRVITADGIQKAGGSSERRRSIENQQMKTLTNERTTNGQSLLLPVSDGTAGRKSDVLGVQHSDRAHSKISPSKLKSLELCPCFVDEERDPHPDTLQGTLCHEALDSGDDSKLTTDEQRGWVKMCRDYVADLMRDYYSKKLPEERLEIVDGIWGFADLILLSEDTTSGALIDYKFGANGQEDAETNPAAQAYVLGMFNRWPELESVTVSYLYPRRDEISNAEYWRKDVAELELRIRTIVARAKAQLERGCFPEVCTWCGNKATCPALHKQVLPIATRYAEHKGLELAPMPDLALVKDPHTWSRLMTLAPVLEALSDSIKHHALEFRQQSGTEIPGYELRNRAGRKTVNNALLAWEVAQQAGLSQQEFLSAVDVSAKRLSEVAGEKAPRGQKAKVAATLEGKLRDTGCLEIGPETFYLAKSKK